MIAVEKLRAICQQMPEYPLRVRKYPRARDFYDIWLLVEHAKIDFGSTEVGELVRSIFSAKEVSLRLLGKISNYREFHEGDWQSVQDSVMGPTESFDFYFDRVVEEVLRIKSL